MVILLCTANLAHPEPQPGACKQNCQSGKGGHAVRASTTGRPRALTDEQVGLVLHWHEEVMAWKAQQPPTLRQLARNLGVPPATLYNAVRRRGEFKVASASHVTSTTKP